MRCKVRRGEIYMVDLEGAWGSELRNGPANYRLCVVVQNDTGNSLAPTTIVAPVRNFQPEQRQLPHNVAASGYDRGCMDFDYEVMCGQLRTVDRQRLADHAIGTVTDIVLDRIDQALRISLQIDQPKMARQTA